ncbi:MAG: SusC/RagA family TonB-linked outer membrane protein [Bacteroidaceae bacterium]|nr:SusC/RagA family TonB-linked outer membrane protein [Bacteroidaceae bacterium]
MKTVGYICLSLFLVAAPLAGFAQDDVEEEEIDTTAVQRVRKGIKKQEPTREISGRVVSQQDHAPLAGVLVQSIAGTGYSALTEEDGTFRLQVPLYSSAVEVTIPGYNKVRVGLNESGKLRDIVMQSDAARALYGDDDNILGHSRAKGFDFSSAANIATEIENQLGAEVRTTERSGINGLGAYMQVSGVGSYLIGAQPLVVIDGVITEMEYDRKMIHSGFYNDILSNFNVNDIESVEVMRNGTALYGAKGANGVILIKTKRNTSLATRIAATASVGVEFIPKHFSMMDGTQFKTYASSLMQSTGTKMQSFKFLDERPYNAADPYNYNYYYNKYANNTDWTKEAYHAAVAQRYGLSVQGGGDVANYMLSIGYLHAGEVIKEMNYNRLNIRFNTDIKITDWIDVRFDASFSNSTRKLYDLGAPEEYDQSTVTSLNFLSYAKSPMLSPYSFVASNVGPGIISTAHLDIEDEDYLAEISQLRNANYQLSNPTAILEYATAQNKNYYDNSYVNLAITPAWHPNKHLKFSSLFSYSLVNTNEKRYIPMNGVPAFWVEAFHQKMQNMIGSLYSRQNSVLSDTKVEWKNRYGAHSIDLLGGFRFMNEGYYLTQQSGYNTGNDKTPQISGTEQKQIDGSRENWATLSWYGQAKYNFANRYYLQGDIAMETNSQFGRDASGLKLAGVVWGIFPSIQAGWVMTNEKWFDVAGVDYLKLQAGYGLSGNDRLPYDAAKSYFKSRLFLGATPALSFENIGNTELKWETTRRFNAGIEGRFLNNRLSAAFNYFYSWTSDLLTLRSSNFLTGINQYWSNGGKLENQGFDVSVNAHLISGNNWNWSVGASMGHYVNKLTELPDGLAYQDHSVLGATIRSKVGSSINQFYGLKTAETRSGGIVYATSAVAAADGIYRLASDGVTKTYFSAGDVKYIDQNHDGRIDDNDRTIIGDANPDIYGNIWTSLSYKRLTLDLGFNYSLGGDVYNYMRQQLESGSRFMNQTTAMLQRWSFEGQTTDIPRATYGDPMGNSAFSDRWIEDGSYLRLKNVTLSYKLPINNTYIQGITVWGNATNLFTITRYLGTDPEFSMGNSVISQGIDAGWVSQGRTVNVGVKINL